MAIPIGGGVYLSGQIDASIDLSTLLVYRFHVYNLVVTTFYRGPSMLWPVTSNVKTVVRCSLADIETNSLQRSDREAVAELNIAEGSPEEKRVGAKGGRVAKLLLASGRDVLRKEVPCRANHDLIHELHSSSISGLS